MKLARGDVALVTGASRGLGVFAAHALAARGVNLALAARSPEALERVAAELRATGSEVLVVPCDVTDPSALAPLVSAVHARFGALDVLVNNAGISESLRFDRVAPVDLVRAIDLNLRAPMLLAQLALPRMLERGRGHIVNIASMAGLMGSPYSEAYVATKHGLVGFTRGLRASAQDLGWPVSASSICPGFMDGAGIYEEMKRDFGVRAPGLMGSLDATRFGAAVVRAVERDLPEVILMAGAPRLVLALQGLAPRLVERVSARLQLYSVFRSVARQRLEARP